MKENYMSRSYDLDEIRDTITSLVSSDFENYGFEVDDLQGTVTLTASVSVVLPDGWEFSGYNNTIEIERNISF